MRNPVITLRSTAPPTSAASSPLPITIRNCSVCAKTCSAAHVLSLPWGRHPRDSAALLALASGAVAAVTATSCRQWQAAFTKLREQLANTATLADAVATAARRSIRTIARPDFLHALAGHPPPNGATVHGLDDLADHHFIVPIRCRPHRGWCTAATLPITEDPRMAWQFIRAESNVWACMIAQPSRSCDEFRARARNMFAMHGNLFTFTGLNWYLPALYTVRQGVAHSIVIPEGFAQAVHAIRAPWPKFVTSQWTTDETG